MTERNPFNSLSDSGMKLALHAGLFPESYRKMIISHADRQVRELNEKRAHFDKSINKSMTTETTYPLPTDDEIKTTIALIEKKLSSPAMEKAANAPMKSGYRKAVQLLNARQTDYEGIEKLGTVQARAIAALAVDYLAGKERQSMLTGVPIR